MEKFPHVSTTLYLFTWLEGIRICVSKIGQPEIRKPTDVSRNAKQLNISRRVRKSGFSVKKLRQILIQNCSCFSSLSVRLPKTSGNSWNSRIWTTFSDPPPKKNGYSTFSKRISFRLKKLLFSATMDSCERVLIFFLVLSCKNGSVTLPETSSSHLKMDGWNTIVSFWGPAYFQGQTCC